MLGEKRRWQRLLLPVCLFALAHNSRFETQKESNKESKLSTLQR
jgi:hypothetical protein